MGRKNTVASRQATAVRVPICDPVGTPCSRILCNRPPFASTSTTGGVGRRDETRRGRGCRWKQWSGRAAEEKQQCGSGAES